MVRYLSEWYMQQFDYVQTIPRSPTQASRDTIARWDLNDIFEDWEQHMVPEEYRLMQESSSWQYVEGYVIWFYTVSHPIMTLDALGHPPRSAHEKILENQQLIGQEALESGIIERGSPEAVSIMERVVSETSSVVGYKRPEEYRLMQESSSWQYVEEYVTWFYTVSHPIMTLDAPRHPSRSAYENILENQQRIQLIGQEALESRIIERGSPEAVAIMKRVVSETVSAVGYRRPRRGQG
ncbi:uncharacterized protein LOC131648465 [Vicia villosa]|uniref:uncharacterized protein LOC131648465 n=1 Tax=Vicia villosa TaxID=3911 RepID=UPI00273B4BF7|nr:uncharacterized protein LOC131648465 [Vicia villosa]